MFAIEVQSRFSAAHALRLPGGGAEPVHGHDFLVTVKITADQLDAIDTVADFHDIEHALNLLLADWRHQNLNDIEPFKSQINPSAERIAEYIGTRLVEAIRTIDEDAPRSRNLRLLEVRLTEAPGCLAIWSPG